MWYTVESDKSTIRNEGEPGCKLTYKNLRELFRLPSFDTMMVGLSGDFNRLMQWSQDAHVRVLPFTFEKDRRIEFDLVSKAENIVVGTVSYGISRRLNATFGRTGDARDILSMLYPHSRIFYSSLGSGYAALSIREILEEC